LDLERDVVEERPACKRFWKLWSGQHCGKRAVFPRSMLSGTPVAWPDIALCADRHLLR